eukprot:2088394-Heterocapsa_arctica.AAC.1
MTNLPANRLWITVSFRGLGAIVAMTKQVTGSPSAESVVATIISEAAKEGPWNWHAFQWMQKALGTIFDEAT